MNGTGCDSVSQPRHPSARRPSVEVLVFKIVMLSVGSRANEGDELRPLDARVLVVDDAPANLTLLKQLLTREGYSVITANDGVEALAIVEREAPDIVLTDVVMPRRDGVDLCRAIKANPASRLIPVVLVTSFQGHEDRLRDRKSTRLNSSHERLSRMPSSA